MLCISAQITLFYEESSQRIACKMVWMKAVKITCFQFFETKYQLNHPENKFEYWITRLTFNNEIINFYDSLRVCLLKMCLDYLLIP